MKKNIITIFVVLVITALAVLSIILVTKYNKKVSVPQTTTQQIVKNTFEYEMLKEVNKLNQDNYLISPYSMKVALTMLLEGSNNETSNAISKVLDGNKFEVIKNDNIKISNALFIKDIYKEYIENNYINKLTNIYNSDILFDKYETPEVINNWVNEKTDGMISKLLNDIDSDFVLGLANAIAIDVKWNNSFKCEQTTESEFTKKDGSKLKVEMMHNEYEGGASYIESDKAKGIVIPYEDETNLEYIAIKPNDNIDQYINSFNKEELDKLLNNKTNADSKTYIQLSLPRYSYSYSLDEFQGVLSKMGMDIAFDAEKADFTKMMTKDNMIKSNAGNLYVGKAVHKTYIDLNEVGTKAAAVTFFGVYKNTSIDNKQPKIINIDFDKSFLYLIREKTTNEVLFVGVVNTPNEWKGTTCKNEE